MMMLTVPQYDAIVLQDRVAYPVTLQDAKKLVRALTGRDGGTPLDWETMGEVTFEMDGQTLRATFTCEGEWPDTGNYNGIRVRMLVAVSNVHVMGLGES